MRRLMFAMVAAVLPAAIAFAETDKDILALRLEIAALQADHALNLTRDQAKALLPLLREGAAEAKQIKAEHEGSRAALLAALTKARDELKATGTVSEGTRELVGAAHGSAQLKNHMAKLGDLRAKAKQILTPAQVEALHAAPFGLSLGIGPEGGFAGHGGVGGGFGGEFGMEEGAAQGPRHGRGPGLMRHMILGHVVTSDAFIALVEARAR